jgi:hypothetical protein
MSKMKKRRLSWVASNSSQVIGYKLYWAEEGGVDYNSQFSELGNITAVVLPDDVVGFTPGNGPVEFGITAIDELGNESDMVTLFTPYQFSVPDAPSELVMETLEEFDTPQSIESEEEASDQFGLGESDVPPRLFKTV